MMAAGMLAPDRGKGGGTLAGRGKRKKEVSADSLRSEMPRAEVPSRGGPNDARRKGLGVIAPGD